MALLPAPKASTTTTAAAATTTATATATAAATFWCVSHYWIHPCLSFRPSKALLEWSTYPQEPRLSKALPSALYRSCFDVIALSSTKAVSAISSQLR